MSLEDSPDERPVEASPARKARAIEQGEGPRAPWLASAITGLLCLALLAASAGPLAAWAMHRLRGALQVQPESGQGLSWSGSLVPAMLGALLVLASVIAGQSIAQGGWVRLATWRRARRPALGARLAATAAGWALGGAALAGGVAGALPWVPALPGLGRRPLGEALWAVGAFTASVALGALIATLACGLLQRRVAQRAFDRSLRMSRSEARESARQEAPVRRPAPRSSRWRLP